jgi:hypothetical protein
MCQRRQELDVMNTSATIRPLNSLVFISDTDGGDVPEWAHDQLILSTPSCIAVGCYPEPDGPTTVTLGPLWQVERDEQPAFSGYLETPNRAVVVSTVDQQTVVEAKVPKSRTHVRIWVNHPRWPDQVTIGLE